MALKIGFVGTGGIARRHFQALEEIPEAQIVACTDVDADRAAEAAARFAGAAACTHHADMLEEQELDAAFVCLPPHVHGEVELALIDEGIPFFVEKPLANDLETAERIMSALEGTDLITSVGYMMRYRDNARRLKEHLADDPPVVARGAYLCGVPGVPWWRRKEQSGGQIVEQSTHVFDLARYLFGEVQSVFCTARRGMIQEVPDYTADDASVCALKFESGLLCTITSSCAVKKGEISMEVFTREARAALEGGDLALTLSVGGETHRYSSEEDAFVREDRAFIEAVVSGDRSAIESPYQDALRTQMVTCAANESMESGEPVQP
ncbi:MAG: Gfo/Idh/MocA family oxidoreductase [Candidatus Brocadiaceae bacterium]|jgi:predicted dehydrogenase